MAEGELKPGNHIVCTTCIARIRKDVGYECDITKIDGRHPQPFFCPLPKRKYYEIRKVKNPYDMLTKKLDSKK